MTKGKSYTRYPAEFKRMALLRASEDGVTDVTVCEDLGISTRQLSRWRDEFRLKGDDAFKASTATRNTEITQLKKELAKVKKERDFFKRCGGVLRQGVRLKFRCIKRHRDNYSIQMMCKALSVSRSGFYAWSTRPLSKTKQENIRFTKLISEIHQQSRGVYGAPRVKEVLMSEGHHCSKNRVAKLMAKSRLKGCPKRLARGYAQPNQYSKIAPNRLRRNFKVDAANQVWSSDITYIQTKQGFVYLAVVMDLYSRRIIGWSMDKNMGRHIAMNALTMAVAVRQPDEGLIIHSDQGAQYASLDYQELLNKNGILCSMSRRGNCYDNAVVESFFGSLKRERVRKYSYRSRQEAQLDIFDYIECFYNRKRLHSYLGYKSPSNFEKMTKSLN
ncbi:IS3 family transposase [Thalassotalea nanhaiensis]|uniref:IS3 family transposase n=1 Tax=Thalassotalea nanhaiensis TaxID=3065648 RepID=A0ABY9TGH4_9GAMM|nr:IS3 family transposase [Colwelliaceae bacterium SQ345]